MNYLATKMEADFLMDDSTAWANASQTDKESALALASNYLNRLQWVGKEMTVADVLRCPNPEGDF